MISLFSAILRFTYRTILLCAFLMFVLIPALMLINHHRRADTEAGSRKADLISVRLANSLNWIFGIRIQMTGTPPGGAALVVANHISWLDILVMLSASAMGFVGKAEIDRWPLFSFIARSGGTIFHQRGCHDSAADVNLAMAQRLREGRLVAIFPEGGIKPGSSLRVFHARMFRAAVDVGCPVQPVMVRYMKDGNRDDDISFREGETMMSNLARLLSRPGVIAELHFLPPICAIDQPRRALADAARTAVVESYEAL